MKDLPFGERALVVIWRKRCYRCLEPTCRRRFSVERSSEIVTRRGSTERLRRKLAQADGECRAYARVVAEDGASRWLVNDVVARTASVGSQFEPPPVSWLGIDETRTRRPRRHLDPDTASGRWQVPWMASLTDLDTTRTRVILGLALGVSSKEVCTWLLACSQAWRQGVETATQPGSSSPPTSPRNTCASCSPSSVATGPASRSATPATTSAPGTRSSPTCQRSSPWRRPSTPWWPEIEAFLGLNITNAKHAASPISESTNAVSSPRDRTGRGVQPEQPPLTRNHGEPL